MIKLQERKPPQTENPLITQEQYVRLSELQLSARKMGLKGGSLAPYEAVMETTGSNSKVTKLLENFPMIKEPKFTKEWSWVSIEPRLVMFQLNDGHPYDHYVIVYLRRFWDRFELRAHIPVIPASAQAMCQKFMDTAGTCDLWMIFEPKSWRWFKMNSHPVRDFILKLVGDPVIVAKLSNGSWFKVCEWDGDQELINSLLRKEPCTDQQAS